ncbi:UNVERIFIED_CONTAM: hypothetical protein Slati_2315900 [Sesamum latifolium]|uniref:Uncharacterized protein n=1 Tax=Sesamum latifolium TaxID=2727402 RepID=A0AAW2WAF4_9LAMI
MAVSQIHFRSISLPSRLHPINSTGFEADQLQKLKSCVSKAVPVTSEGIQSGLWGWQNCTIPFRNSHNLQPLSNPLSFNINKMENQWKLHSRAPSSC